MIDPERVMRMARSNDTWTVKAGPNTYFFDLKGTETGQPYLVITQSWRLAEDQERQRSRLVLFADHALDFLAASQAMVLRLLTDGQKFEESLAALFQKLGFEVTATRATGDYGGDLIIQKQGLKTLVQAKRSAGKVGVKAVQEAVAAKGFYQCQRAMVVTNSFFTKSAFELAKANRVILWQRHRLVKAWLYVKTLADLKGKAKPPPEFLARLAQGWSKAGR